MVSRIKILLAEDNKLVYTLALGTLKKKFDDPDIKHVTSAGYALKELQTNTYDLAIMDNQMLNEFPVDFPKDIKDKYSKNEDGTDKFMEGRDAVAEYLEYFKEKRNTIICAFSGTQTTPEFFKGADIYLEKIATLPNLTETLSKDPYKDKFLHYIKDSNIKNPISNSHPVNKISNVSQFSLLNSDPANQGKGENLATSSHSVNPGKSENRF